jgi:hypothetical protein
MKVRETGYATDRGVGVKAYVLARTLLTRATGITFRSD